MCNRNCVLINTHYSAGLCVNTVLNCVLLQCRIVCQSGTVNGTVMCADCGYIIKSFGYEWFLVHSAELTHIKKACSAGLTHIKSHYSAGLTHTLINLNA